jgi:pyridoxal phosphate enzyme (YggS family)
VNRRHAEISEGLDEVRSRIAAACGRAGRSPDEITLIVVTKFFPTSDVRLLHELGVRHVGENRHQEAVDKAAECEDLDLTWHFVGTLQSNKAAAVTAYASVVESVDRAKLVRGLSKGAHERGRTLDVLVQVSLDSDTAGTGRSGVDPEQAEDLARRVATAEGLRLRGVMGVAPLGEDPVPAFEKLGRVAGRIRLVEPAATWISAGMSQDFEAAIESGATHVRIGSAVLGERPR